MTRDFGRASSPVFTFGIAPKTTPSAGKELVERYCHTKGRNIALAFLIVPLQTSGTGCHHYHVSWDQWSFGECRSNFHVSSRSSCPLIYECSATGTAYCAALGWVGGLLSSLFGSSMIQSGASRYGINRGYHFFMTHDSD